MAHFRIHYNALEVCRTILTERLNALGISFSLNANGELSIHGKLTDENRLHIEGALQPYGISLVEKESESIVEGIKYAIEELLSSPAVRTEKVSAYLSEKLGYSYSSLSNRFSEETHTSIENFVILRRIEHAKRLMLLGGTSLTEIARKLDYSSVAHLSRQFKKTTGLTPTSFLRIIAKRKNTS
ncbi:helix-turn-helix domain-containing protein [Pricia sp.]|uniref:helix-turn-helix domain-containing protein n=1 Tax=Pricia sp. TaxID=2268138 RepID=UPI0035939B77